eukprot:s2737_g19.t1
MTSLIDSSAQYESQLKDAGLTAAFVDSLKRHGVRTLGQLAFAVGQPGQPIQDNNVEQLVQNALGRAPTLQEIACLKRAAFEAQTYLTATLRQAVDRSEDAMPRKIPFAERQTRMDALKLGLAGLSVTGEHEPAHSLLDRACAMYEANSLKYLDLASCVSRSLEAQGTTKNRELTLEKGSLVMKSNDDKLQSPTDSEIKVHYAMVRRGLAFQFSKLMSYHQHTEWETFLFEAMHRDTPPGFGRPSLSQLLQCDKAAFSRLASTMPSIRQRDDGSYPLGIALLELRNDPMIALYLAPVAKAVHASNNPNQPSSWRSQPYQTQTTGSKGKGSQAKGKSKGKSPPVPQELRGKWHKTSSGDPICFGFNCKSGCPEKNIKPGQRCSKGYHICAEPRCGGEHSLQQHGSK